MEKYDVLKLRTITNYLSMLQKERVYSFLKSENPGIVQDVSLAVLDYWDTRDALFPFARRSSLRNFKNLLGKMEEPSLKEVVEDNLSFLKEKKSFSPKVKELKLELGF